MSSSGPRILVVGGGYVGMYTAYRLQKKLKPGEGVVTVIDPQSYMTYQPFLPEAAAGNLEPRHVVVPLRRLLSGCQVVTGTVTGVDHARRTATYQPLVGEQCEISYDVLVMAPGSIVRTLPVPGLADVGIGFKTVAEAIYLRNHVIARLDAGQTCVAPDRRRRALTFCLVGGGYAGIECLAELEDMTRHALRYYPAISPSDVRWVLVEATGRILPEVSEDMSVYTLDRLRERGIDCRLSTRVNSCGGGHVELDDGEVFDTDTFIWTAGVKPSPLVTDTDLPSDDKRRLRCTASLRIDGVDDAWSAGDCAAVPDLTGAPGAMCAPTAQHSVRQARQLADNLIAALRGTPVKDYKHAYAGSVASLGLHKGVADVYGVKMRGLPAWFVHRTYHMTRIPTLNRKVRVVGDWTLALFFRREFISLGSFANPRRAFEEAALPAEQDAPSRHKARAS
jgi:NADH dehydrogenase